MAQLEDPGSPHVAAGGPVALAREVAHFRRVIDEIPGLVWSAKPDGYIEFLNKRWLDYTGLSLEQIQGWRWTASDMIHPDDLPQLTETWRRILASREGGAVEARLRRFDRTYRWHLFQFMPMHDVSGELVQWWGLNVDIDELKHVLRELRQAKEFMAQAQRLSHTGSFSWRLDTGEVTWSEEMYRIYDLAPSVTPSLELARGRVHPEDTNVFEDHARRLPGSTEVFSFEHRLLFPEGRVKHIRVMGSTVVDGAGKAVEIIGALIDMTERVHAAEALRASERLARGQLNAITGVLSILAEDCDQDRFLEQVLRTIVTELSAHSIRVWVAAEGSDRFDCVADCRGGRVSLFKAADSEQPPHAPWSRIFRDARSCAIGTLTSSPPRVSVEGDADGPEPRSWDVDVSDPLVRPLLERWEEEGIRTVLWIPMLMARTVIGCLTVNFTTQHSFRTEEIELGRALAHQVALAIQLTRLSRDTRDAAVVAERNRLARDIHDTLAQGLTGVIVQLEAAEDAIARGWSGEASGHVTNAKNLARESLKEARRSVSALRPGALERTSLRDALHDLMHQMTEGTQVKAKLVVKGTPRRILPAKEEHLLRIGQEAMTNTLRHARARRMGIELAFGKKSVRLTVKDDGRGFALSRRREGFGLRGIKERVEAVGGRLTLRSGRGIGTHVSVTVGLDGDR